ncbi:MAG TPA: TolC family protein [Kiritimatiellia bacterium]|nr:TolC family protein [Kiritimatiellia bacterium]HRU70004.1 TolC family protein [Kiritimatiellia bacterium]
MFRIVQRTFSVPFILSIGAVAAVGCRNIAPAPIDWPHESAAWSGAVTNSITLTAATARELALVLNPEINALRLSRQNADREVLAAGWWEDPALDLDALRVLRGGPHPWILGTGLRFSLPLTGVPGLEKRAARAYAQADALAVAAAERELLAEVERCWSACATDRRCAAAQEAYLERLAERERQVAALVAAGELPPEERERLTQERIKLETACPCCSAEAVARRHALLRAIGLHPDAPVDFEADEEPQPDALAALFGVPPEHELDLVRHPRVQEKLARFAGSEAALRAELRRQYPDLEIGPAVEHEEGGARAGLGVGFRLPLWNRNRRGIAEAESARDSQRLEAVTAWRALVAEWHEARAMLASAERLEQSLREERLAAAQAAGTRTERLYRQGEASLTDLIAAEAAVYEVREAWIEATRGLNEARIRLALLNVVGRPE